MITIAGFSVSLPVLALAGALFLLAFWVLWLQLRLHRLLRGGNGKDLDSVLYRLGNDVKTLYNARDEMKQAITTAEDRLQRSVQHVRVLRFNPFRDGGGDQSFTVALLDEKKNGVVFSSFHSRDGVRIYAKPVAGGGSMYPLSGEEQEAIKPSA